MVTSPSGRALQECGCECYEPTIPPPAAAAVPRRLPSSPRPAALDTCNRFLVAATGSHVLMMVPPREPMTPDEALTLAAWLFAVAGGDRQRFEEILRQVLAT